MGGRAGGVEAHVLVHRGGQVELADAASDDAGPFSVRTTAADQADARNGPRISGARKGRDLGPPRPSAVGTLETARRLLVLTSRACPRCRTPAFRPRTPPPPSPLSSSPSIVRV